MTNPLLYRLWRLRRLVALVLLLPAVSLVALWLLTSGTAAATRPGIAIPTLAATSLFLLFLVLRYPRAPDEALAFSLSFAALLLLTPLYELLVAQRDGPLEGGHYVGLAVLLLVGWVLVFVGTAFLLDRLMRKSRHRQCNLTLVHSTTLGPEAVRAALRPIPDHTSVFGRSGPLAKDGSFPVWPDFRLPEQLMPAPTEGGPWGATRAPGYWTTVTDEGPFAFGTVTRLPDGSFGVTHYMIEPTATGSRIGKTETSNALTRFGAVLVFLMDVDRDLLIAHLDHAEGLDPPRAIRLQPFGSLLRNLANSAPPDDKPPFL
jgi:hypothetical protein